MKDWSQLTKFEDKSLSLQHVADVKTGFLKTGFDNTVSCSVELDSAYFWCYNIPHVFIKEIENEELNMDF